MDFFDDLGMVNPEPEGRSINGILYLAELITLKEISGEDFLHHLRDFIRCCNLMEKDGEFAQTPWTTIDIDRASHDNITAIVTISKRFNLAYHKRLKTRYYIYRFSDFIYYNWLRGSWWSYGLMWIHTIAVAVSCWRNSMAPNGLPDTDGKILSWLRFSNVSMPITKWIGRLGLRRLYGNDWPYKLFSIYFGRHLNHPIILEAQKVYLGIS